MSLNLIRCLSRYRGTRKKAVNNRQLCCRVRMNHPCNTFKTEATFIPKNWQRTPSVLPDSSLKSSMWKKKKKKKEVFQVTNFKLLKLASET